MSRLTDDTKVINEFISQKLLPAVITLIGSIVMLFIMDWQMTLLTFIAIPIFMAIMIPLGRKMQKISMNTQTEIANFSGLLGRVLTEMRLVKVSNTEKQELNNAHSNLREIYNLGLRQAKITAVIQPISSDYVTNDCSYLRFRCDKNSNWCYYSGCTHCNDFYVMQLSMPLMNLSTLVRL